MKLGIFNLNLKTFCCCCKMRCADWVTGNQFLRQSERSLYDWPLADCREFPNPDLQLAAFGIIGRSGT